MKTFKTSRLHKFFYFLIGCFLHILWGLFLSSYNFFRLRFKIPTSERLLQAYSKWGAKAAFWSAYYSTPGYKKFIDNAFKDELPADFSQIPLMTKKNYLVPNSIAEMLKGGLIPKAGQIDTSSGTTGKPATWIRGKNEHRAIKTIICYTTKYVMGNSPFIFINAFALGPWATGMTISGAVSNIALTLSTGPDIEKILDLLQDLRDVKQPIAIAGYPPFIKKLTEVAVAKRIDLSQYDLTALVGGEGISETARQKIIDGGFKRVFSSYGASDLDVSVGYESDFQICLRKECIKNPKLARALYGESRHVPMIFMYDPLSYFIETDSERNLIFTCIRQDRISPRIRYQLGDEGLLISMSDVLSILKLHHVTLTDSENKEILPEIHLPLIFVWGRQGSAVDYNGSNVTPEQLECALEKLPLLKVENYGLSSYEDSNSDQRMQILIELAVGIELKDLDKNALQNEVIEQLMSTNQEFKFEIEKAKENSLWLPELILYSFGTGPMTNQAPHRKKQHIFFGDQNPQLPAI